MYPYCFTFIISLLFYGCSSLPWDGKNTSGQKMSSSILNFPYQLSLNVNGKSNCSATIISKYWALTSARCLDSGKTPAAQVSFRAGSAKKDRGGTIHPASRIFINPVYNPNTYDFDTALVEVKTPFPLGTPGVNKVLLAWEVPPDGTIANVSGWTVTDNNKNQQTNELHYVEVPLVNGRVCKGVHAMTLLVTQRMICTGYAKGGKGPCEGDIGSPLVVDGSQIGIVTQPFCGKPNSPSVYSNIPEQRIWIRDTAGV